VERIRAAVASTTGGVKVLGGLGGFAGLVELPQMKNPVLVSATDGVGTKVLIAEAMGFYSTVGIDLVAMSVNDLITTGAKPLFFLDYLATGRLEPDKAAALIEGVAAGCRMAGCALLGGETAEMPDVYQGGDFDLAGFAVGIVEKDEIIDGSGVREGDVIIGLPASGIHSNGLSLARKILEHNNISYSYRIEQAGFESIGRILLTPTEIYTAPVAAVREVCEVRAMAHITGGGLPENLPRVIPDGLTARVDRSNWLAPRVFTALQSLGKVEEQEMFRTFNMGVGYALVVRATDEKQALAAAPGSFSVGEIISGGSGIEFVGD
jgi:phosphoribosylformylglycinamidine cyclo-ligase